ncbi:hypothetical protein A0R60_0774 [Enterobacter asburiae]|nr:hypothetical protein A0R60_0774 [Enterobacter asburiae]
MFLFISSFRTEIPCIKAIKQGITAIKTIRPSKMNGNTDNYHFL